MKKAQIIFLLTLLSILIFIVGFRSGQKVEKTNKIIDFITSITPYPTYTPYPSPTKEASMSPTIKQEKIIPTKITDNEK
ncbi:hypothetical protein B6D29_02870 [Microgenomates bacterium UTCPR1]|nr:MAG: hypothetical protein B6D29_02870 [Microgenomates bacterium UTCPR1]